MATYAAESMIADALIYGHRCQLQPRPAQVLVNADDTVTLDPGTRIIHAPPRRVKGAVVGRKWPRGEEAQLVLEVDGDYVAVAARPCDCLLGLMAESNCRNANALGKAQLLAVWYCVLHAPFPLGGGDDYYGAALAMVEADALERATAALTALAPKTQLGAGLWAAADQMSVGQIRQALVIRAGSGCNAPTDSYLALAAALAAGQPTLGY